MFAKINRSDFFLISYLRKKIHIKIFQSKFVLFSQWHWKFIPFYIIFNPFVPIYLNAFTVQNIVFSPNFMVWKFCGNSFRKASSESRKNKTSLKSKKIHVLWVTLLPHEFLSRILWISHEYYFLEHYSKGQDHRNSFKWKINFFQN